MAARKQTSPPCEGCQHEPHALGEEFTPLLWLIGKVGGALFDAWGGVNVAAIEAVMRNHRVPKADRPALFDQILLYASALRGAKNG